MKKDIEEIRRLKMSANSSKDKLLDIASILEYVGAVREANSLYTIIGKLEAWQNK